MRKFLSAAMIFGVFASCNKDKYTSAPQIKFKSVTPSFLSNSTLPPDQGPKVTIEITDAEGDIGFDDEKDTSYVFIKNITVPPFKIDSLKFPSSLTAARHKNFKADADILLNTVLARTCTAGCVDSLHFEIYITDFAKHKSNVIRTDSALYFITP